MLTFHAMGNTPYELVLPCVRAARLADCGEEGVIPLSSFFPFPLSSLAPNLHLSSFPDAVSSLANANESLRVLSNPHREDFLPWAKISRLKTLYSSPPPEQSTGCEYINWLSAEVKISSSLIANFQKRDFLKCYSPEQNEFLAHLRPKLWELTEDTCKIARNFLMVSLSLCACVCFSTE
jgi:hypothetical protein